MSTGWVGSGLCPTRTRPEWGKWMKNWPETDPKIWSDFSVRVSSVLSWFGLVSGFITEAKIWPDLARSGRNLFRAVEIMPKSGRICQDLARSRRIWTRFRRKWSESCNNSSERERIRFGSGVTGFKRKTDNQPAWGRVSEFGTRVRSPKSSDWVVAGRTQAGWPGWAGHRVYWTPQIAALIFSPKKKKLSNLDCTSQSNCVNREPVIGLIFYMWELGIQIIWENLLNQGLTQKTILNVSHFNWVKELRLF